MRESIHKYFRVGTIQWMSYPNSSPVDSLKAIAKDDYFDAIELRGYGSAEANAEAKAIRGSTSRSWSPRAVTAVLPQRS